MLAQERVPVRVFPDAGEFVVIQPGAPQAAVIQRETQRLNQVKPHTGVGAQADDIAGVGGDLRLVEDDFQHSGDSVPVRSSAVECCYWPAVE